MRIENAKMWVIKWERVEMLREREREREREYCDCKANGSILTDTAK